MGGVAGEAGEGKRRAVDAGGEEAAEDDAVEGGVGAAWWTTFVSFGLRDSELERDLDSGRRDERAKKR